MRSQFIYIYINLVFSFAKIIIASFILNDTDTYTYYQHYYLPVSICLSWHALALCMFQQQCMTAFVHRADMRMKDWQTFTWNKIKMLWKILTWVSHNDCKIDTCSWYFKLYFQEMLVRSLPINISIQLSYHTVPYVYQSYKGSHISMTQYIYTTR